MTVKVLGTYQRTILMEGLEAFSLAILMRFFGWSKDEVEII